MPTRGEHISVGLFPAPDPSHVNKPHRIAREDQDCWRQAGRADPQAGPKPGRRIGRGIANGIVARRKLGGDVGTHEPPNLVLLSTGVGKPKQLTSNGWDYTATRYWIRWMPNSAALSVLAIQPGHKPRMFLLDVATKEMRPILPEGVRGALASPDGKLLFAVDGTTPKIYSISADEIRALPKLASDDVPDRWAADGKSIFIWNYSSAPRLDRIDIATGKRVPAITISPPDRTGIVGFNFCRTSKDGRAHIYSA